MRTYSIHQSSAVADQQNRSLVRYTPLVISCDQSRSNVFLSFGKVRNILICLDQQIIDAKGGCTQMRSD